MAATGVSAATRIATALYWMTACIACAQNYRVSAVVGGRVPCRLWTCRSGTSAAWPRTARETSASARLASACSNWIPAALCGGWPGLATPASRATAAQLNWPSGLAVDASGNLYLADFSEVAVATQNAPQNEPGPPRFDVVSVKVDYAGTGGAGDEFPEHGTWRWTRIPLSFLVRYAYHVSLEQVVGVPGSFQGPQTAFNIVAKMPADVSHERFRMMLQSLLADRFKFVMHRETRDLPAYTVEVAKGGPKLQPASGQCEQAPQSATLPPDRHRCGVVEHHVQIHDDVIGHEYSGWSVSMGDLAAALSANGPVVNDTGIQGIYDIHVTISTALSPPPSDDPEERSNREFEYQRNFTAAFQKQLGLSIDLTKLKKRPLPVIVIDHVELPTPN